MEPSPEASIKVLPAFRHTSFMRALLHACAIGVLLFTSTGCFEKTAPFALSELRDAPAHLKKQRLEFQGIIHPDLAGVHEWKKSASSASKTGGGVKRSRWKYVIPVTDSDWKKGEPVSLWITFSSFREDVTSEIRALKAALSRGSVVALHRDFPDREMGVLRGTSAWQHAVANAESRHGIKSRPRAPIVSWKP